MRFLLDENLSPRACSLLIAAGHQATHVRAEGMASASDHEVLIKAAADVAALLLANLTSPVVSALTDGAFVVLTPESVRVRRLPLR